MPKNVFAGDGNISDGEVADESFLNSPMIFGDGSDGSYTSGNNLSAGVVYNFSDFTLNSGDTMTVASTPQKEPIIVKVQGNVTIDGSVDLKGVGPTGGGGQGGNGMAGHGDASSMEENWKDMYRSNSSSNNVSFPAQNYHPNYRYNPMGGSGAFQSSKEADNDAGYFPGDGGTRAPKMIRDFKPYMLPCNISHILPGAGGGGSAPGDAGTSGGDTVGGPGGGGGASAVSNGGNGSNGGNYPGTSSTGPNGVSGGDGGGAIIFLVGGDLTLNGTIDVRGQNGQDGNNSGSNSPGSGGGGGGGGGTAVLIYKGSLSDSGSKLASGGSGGAGGSSNYANGGSGGSGGNGQILLQTVN